MNTRQMRRQLILDGLSSDEIEDRLADDAERLNDEARDRELEDLYQENP